MSALLKLRFRLFNTLLNYKNNLSLLALMLAMGGAQAATTLAVGDIVFVGLNFDGSDEFSFVLLKDVDATTQIRFSDCGANDPGTIVCASGDGESVWTSGVAVSAGTVVTISALSTANNSQVTVGPGSMVVSPNPLDQSSMSTTGDQILAYQGTLAAPVFLAGINSKESATDANWNGSTTGNQDSAAPDVLLASGVNAAFRLHSSNTEIDNWQFDCVGGTVSGTAQQIRDTVNVIGSWSSNDTTAYSPAAKACTYTVFAPFATTTAAAFNTTNGTNLTPSFSFGAANETLTIANASHLAGSIADGGDGTDTLQLSNGHDISATTVNNFETLEVSPGNDGATMTVDQFNAFTSIVGTGILTSRPIKLSSSGTVNQSLGNPFFLQTTVVGSQTITSTAATISGTSLSLGSITDNVIITGSAGNQNIGVAGGNNNIIDAGPGDDFIRVTSGVNTINGNSGSDTIIPGSGVDTLTGGTENDTFSGTITSLNGDVITDIAVGDKIIFNDGFYSSVAAVRFGPANNTLEVDIGGTDFSTIEVIINMPNNPGLTLAPVLVSTLGMDDYSIEISFVSDVTGPTLYSSSPADAAIAVAADSNITLTFNENIAFGTGNIQVIDVTDGSNSFTIDAASPGTQASITGTVLTINPSSDMDAGANYAVQIAPTAIDDVKGNSYAGIIDNTTLDFTTLLPPPTVAATLTDILQTDTNTNGLVNPGDTLRYTAVLGSSVASAVGVNFTLSSDSLSTLVVGSVATSQGTVTTGNTAGNTSVAVNVGSIASGANATITFDVTAGTPSTSPDSISLQGAVSGSNFTTLNTDDPATGTTGDATAISFDGVGPRIAAIFRQQATPTASDSVVWRVNFNEGVTGLDGADFTVGGTTATITGVSAITPLAYDLTASGGDLASFTGTVTLGFTGAQNITDIPGNALTNLTPTGTNNNTYVLDNTAPRIASIVRQSPATSPTNADSLVWDVTFDSAVSNVNVADFAVTGTTATATAVANTSGNTYRVTVSGGDLAGLNATATLGFSGAQNIADALGNTLANTTPTGTNNNTYVLDNTAPRIASIVRQSPATSPTNADSLVWDVTFDSAVSNVNVADFAVTGTTATAAAVVNTSGNTYRVTVSGGDLAGLNATATLGFSGAQNIADTVGNTLTNTTPTATNDNTFVVDNAGPSLAITISDNALSDGETATVTFTFTKTPVGFVVGDASTVDNGALSAFAVDGSDDKVYTATFTPTAGVSDATNVISVLGSSYTDGAGNAGNNASSPNYTISDSSVDALTKVGTAATGNDASTVTVADLNAITGVSGAIVANLSAYQAAIAAVSSTDVDTPAEIQALVTSVNAIEEVKAAAVAGDASGVTFTELNSITGVSSALLANEAAYQAAIAAAASVDVDTATEIEALIVSVNVVEEVKAAAAANSATGVTFTELNTLLNANSVALTANETAYQTAIAALASADVATAAKIIAVVKQVNALEVIKAYADDNTQTSPTASDYFDMGIVGVTSGNLAEANQLIDNLVSSDVDTSAKVRTAIAAVLLDTDADTVGDEIDADDDNDGIADSYESIASSKSTASLADTGKLQVAAATSVDTDGDGIADSADADSDNDGIPDAIEYRGVSAVDADGDGRLDSFVDGNADGLSDTVSGQAPVDTDGDGLPDYRDTDSDGDGKSDLLETAGPILTAVLDKDGDGVIDNTTDADKDGQPDVVDPENSNAAPGNKLTPLDTDGDGIADQLDKDSDNDGTPDSTDQRTSTSPDVLSSDTGASANGIFMLLSLLGLSLLRLRRSIVAVIGLVLSGMAGAGDLPIELEIGMGHTHFDPELQTPFQATGDVDPSYAIALGYRFHSNWLAQLRYNDLGRVEVGTAYIDYEALSLNVQGELGITESGNVKLFGLVGVASLKQKARGLSVEEENTTEAHLAGGIKVYDGDVHWGLELGSYNEGVGQWQFVVGTDF